MVDVNIAEVERLVIATKHYLDKFKSAISVAKKVTPHDLAVLIQYVEHITYKYYTENKPVFEKICVPIREKIERGDTLIVRDADIVIELAEELLKRVVKKYKLSIPTAQAVTRTIEDCCKLLKEIDNVFDNTYEEVQDLEENIAKPVESDAAIARPERPVSWFEVPAALPKESWEYKQKVEELTPRVPVSLTELYNRAYQLFDKTGKDALKQMKMAENVLSELKFKLMTDCKLSLHKADSVTSYVAQLLLYVFRMVEGLAGGSWDVFGWFWKAIKGVIDGVKNAIGKAFGWMKDAFSRVYDIIKGAINKTIDWTWKGLTAVGEGIKKFASSIVDGLRKIYDYFLKGLNLIFAALMKLLDSLFRVTEDAVMKYALWQAKASYQVGKIVSETF